MRFSVVSVAWLLAAGLLTLAAMAMMTREYGRGQQRSSGASAVIAQGRRSGGLLTLTDVHAAARRLANAIDTLRGELLTPAGGEHGHDVIANHETDENRSAPLAQTTGGTTPAPGAAAVVPVTLPLATTPASHSTSRPLTPPPPPTATDAAVVAVGNGGGLASWPAVSSVAAMTPASYRNLLRSTQHPHGISSPGLAATVRHYHQPNATETVEALQDGDVAYFIKACKKFNDRARAMYDHWGKSVQHAYFSTDQLLDGIPAEKQIVTSLDGAEMKKAIQESAKYGLQLHALSCFLTTINLGRLLAEESAFPAVRAVKWLAFLDDDTFVIPHNLREYLGAFASAGDWYLGLSSAEIPEVTAGSGVGGDRRWLPVTATAPGVVYSRGALDRLRRGEAGLNLSNRFVATGVCYRSNDKDDVALGYMALAMLRLTYVARPDLRGYHFAVLPDPAHLKPLTVHAELQGSKVDADQALRALQQKYASR